MYTRTSLVASLLLLTTVHAQTSLYIPGFDEQAISADVLGVDDKGRTTWQLHRGQSTASNDDESGFTGTFTLVEGTDVAAYTLVDPKFTVTYDCSISGDIAACVAGASDGQATATETVSKFLVQVGSTAAGGAAPTGGSGSGSKPTGSETTGSSGAKATNSNSASQHFKSNGVVFGFAGLLLSLLG